MIFGQTPGPAFGSPWNEVVFFISLGSLVVDVWDFDRSNHLDGLNSLASGPQSDAPMFKSSMGKWICSQSLAHVSCLRLEYWTHDLTFSDPDLIQRLTVDVDDRRCQGYDIVFTGNTDLHMSCSVSSSAAC